MRALSRKCGVPLRKRSFNKENVRISRERDDRGTIGWGIGDVGDVGNLLASSDGEEITQTTEPLDATTAGRCSIDSDQMIIRAAFDDGALERAQPRTDGKPALHESVPPDVDMSCLLQRKTEAGRVMLKDRSRHAKGGLIAQDTAGGDARG